jgi:hypothetical protein
MPTDGHRSILINSLQGCERAKKNKFSETCARKSIGHINGPVIQSVYTLKHLDISWPNLDKSLADLGKVILLYVLVQSVLIIMCDFRIPPESR